MVIQNAAFMELLGLKRDLAHQFTPGTPSLAFSSVRSSVTQETPKDFFGTLPVSDLNGDRVAGPVRVAACGAQRATRRSINGTGASFTANHTYESSLTALQCLIFTNTYYLCLVKPCQAHDYILIASIRAQNPLKSASLDPKNQELIRRALWVALLIESELATQLDLTNRSVWTLDYEVPLPSWSYPVDEARPSHFSAPADSPGGSFSNSQSSSQLFSYFLAETAMRRMLQRCTASTQRLPSEKQSFAPVISTELQLQLEQWHSHLPEFLRFDRYFISECNTNPQLLFLRTQYHAYRASILWPEVHQALVEGEEYDKTLLPFCLEFHQTYNHFILSAAACIPQCLPNIWTLYASVFNITMAAL
ncbi:uncharacterized protein N7484_009829 [Penicillium longicatenatum]|uniref:uncharacterized protein n=1 Tax=Penicillium longicatenatum TaxID=1561947 RepID=UPI002546916E|nr:uncharacterized protein N7484_009829 [Penicillium longicatenatum]KAJ5636516.1 hypothetical protein N7484_009829 [Penicillium longicatenatum]